MHRPRDVGCVPIGICSVSADRRLSLDHTPEIFEDPVEGAGHWVLCTSALFSKDLREYDWGEVRRTCHFIGGQAILTIFYLGRAG